jgi:hypothetical protein
MLLNHSIFCIIHLFVYLVDIATQALEKYNIEKDIAAYIKKEFDKKYNPTWHW